MSEGQAGVLGITPAMIEAGVKAFLAWEESEDYSVRRAIEAVYRAMSSKAPLGHRPSA